MVACWLAATKVGAVVVNTMPMLRAHELKKYVEKAEISHALSDKRLIGELQECAKTCKSLRTVVGFDGSSNHDAELDRLALEKPVGFKLSYPLDEAPLCIIPTAAIKKAANAIATVSPALSRFEGRRESIAKGRIGAR